MDTDPTELTEEEWEHLLAYADANYDSLIDSPDEEEPFNDRIEDA